MTFDKHFSPRSFISPEAALDKGLKLSTASTGTELDHNDHRMKHNTIIYDTIWYDMIWHDMRWYDEWYDQYDLWKMNQQDWKYSTASKKYLIVYDLNIF